MKKMTRVIRRLRSANKKLDRRSDNLFNKALIVEITPEIHRLIKHRSAERNVTMRLWVTRAITRALKMEMNNE
jgi:predicted HicB family RNase H-like nuclease